MTKSYNGRKAVTFYVPDEILESIDNLARSSGLTRSKYLASKLTNFILFNNEPTLCERITNNGMQIFFNEYHEPYMTVENISRYIEISAYTVKNYLRDNSEKYPDFKAVKHQGLDLYSTAALVLLMEFYRKDLMLENIERGVSAIKSGNFDDTKMKVESKMEKWGNLDELDISFIKQESKKKRGKFKTKEYVYTPKVKKSGKIYLIGNVEKGVCKIGFSTCVEQRLKALQTSCPFMLELLSVIPTPQTLDDEADLHNHFDGLRLSGEWFTLTNEILEFFQSANA
jgi:Meiotically up-regulated gene 113